MAELAIEYEVRLVEDAVLRALWDRPDERVFRKERDRVYEIDEPEGRETAFRSFHARWFEQLGLDRPIAQALGERPSILARIARCLVVYASSASDEGAELFLSSEQGEPRGVVVLRLRPETLTLADRLRSLLRHELTHIADMLDPHFGYEPRFPDETGEPARGRLLRDRYRVLWDAFIDGRLARAGWARVGIRHERLADFARAFPMLGERTERAFRRFFEGTNLTHAELAAFAADPEAALGRVMTSTRKMRRLRYLHSRAGTHAG